jgi:hypothetical protein
MAELEKRAGIKFSGKNGCVQPSGEDSAVVHPTYRLIRDVIKVIGGLPSVLFDKSVKDRPCGLLCKYGAVGMLICDVLGLPLVPWVLAEPIGKEAAKKDGELSAQIKKAKKAANRKGEDVQEAEAAVARRSVKLPLPTPVEIARSWRLIQNASAPLPSLETPVSLETPLPATDTTQPAASASASASPAPAPVPAPTSEPVMPEGVAYLSESSVEQLKTSEVIGRAIMAAHNLEYWLERQPWPIDADLSDESSDESDSGIDEEAEVNPSPPHAIPRVVSSKPSPTQSSPTH